MILMAIDPGNEKSGWVIIDRDENIIEKGINTNAYVLDLVKVMTQTCDYLAIEMPASYGMPVGKTVFDTCVWVGRFMQVFGEDKSFRIYRKSVNPDHGIDSVCMHLCKSTRANDSNVRRALLDRFPGTGRGKTPQIGTKSFPGPLWGVSGDIWAALAVAITFLDWYHESAILKKHG